MTLQDFFDTVSGNPAPALIYFGMLPIVAAIVNFASGRESYESPWRYIYSGLVYAACVPGMLALVLCVYTLFFEPHRSLLQVSALIYFLPLLIMVASLLIMTRKVQLSYIPGFGKLSGLMMMLAVTFITILFIQKTRLWIMFHGSMFHLMVLFLVLFGIFYFGWYRLFGGRKSGTPPRNRKDVEVW